MTGTDARRTSDRHTKILNDYAARESIYYDWAAHHLGDIRLTSWAWGRVSLDWQIGDKLVLPDGVMFGGHVASVADHIATLVTMTVLSRDEDRFRTSRLETNYFRPVMRPSLRVEAKVTNASRTLLHVEADLFTPEDKLAVRLYAVQVRRAGNHGP